ncbi:MAG: hypothetical protein RJA13_1933 [Bacteroidota bacterium]|jgi:RHS repeat-associated protein
MIRPSNRASIRNISDYSPFGVQLAERTISGDGYRFGFMGFERDNEVKGNGNSYTTEFRQYDPRLGRWLSVDPLAHKFAGWSPYVAFADNPIFFTDPDGRAPAGPGDRVKKAKSFVSTPYKQQYEWSGKTRTYYRTGTSESALEYLDCSELVCRVLADDGLTSGITTKSTKDLIKFFNNTDKWHKSDVPQVGDVFLWDGHTGMVTGVNEDGSIEITHAANTKRGTVVDKNMKISYFTKQKGWQGFIRPVTETSDDAPTNKGNPTELQEVKVVANRTAPKLLTKLAQTIETRPAESQEIIENKKH